MGAAEGEGLQEVRQHPSGPPGGRCHWWGEEGDLRGEGEVVSVGVWESGGCLGMRGRACFWGSKKKHGITGRGEMEESGAQ